MLRGGLAAAFVIAAFVIASVSAAFAQGESHATLPKYQRR